MRDLIGHKLEFQESQLLSAVREIDIGLAGSRIHGSDLSLNGMGKDIDFHSMMTQEQSSTVIGVDDVSERPQETELRGIQAIEVVQAVKVETTLLALGFLNVQHLKDSVVDDD